MIIDHDTDVARKDEIRQGRKQHLPVGQGSRNHNDRQFDRVILTELLLGLKRCPFDTTDSCNQTGSDTIISSSIFILFLPYVANIFSSTSQTYFHVCLLGGTARNFPCLPCRDRESNSH